MLDSSAKLGDWEPGLPYCGLDGVRYFFDSTGLKEDQGSKSCNDEGFKCICKKGINMPPNPCTHTASYFFPLPV